MNGTSRCKLYRLLKLIVTLPVPSYTITIDFVSTLPKAAIGEDTILNSTCKFSKKINIIPRFSTWIVEQ